MTVSERGVFSDQFEKALSGGELTDFGAATRSLRACIGFGHGRFAAMARLPLTSLRDTGSNRSNVNVLKLNSIHFPFGFQPGITRFRRSTYPDPEGYLRTGLATNHRERYP